MIPGLPGQWEHDWSNYLEVLSFGHTIMNICSHTSDDKTDGPKDRYSLEYVCRVGARSNSSLELPLPSSVTQSWKCCSHTSDGKNGPKDWVLLLFVCFFRPAVISWFRWDVAFGLLLAQAGSTCSEACKRWDRRLAVTDIPIYRVTNVTLLPQAEKKQMNLNHQSIGWDVILDVPHGNNGLGEPWLGEARRIHYTCSVSLVHLLSIYLWSVGRDGLSGGGWVWWWWWWWGGGFSTASFSAPSVQLSQYPA